MLDENLRKRLPEWIERTKMRNIPWSSTFLDPLSSQEAADLCKARGARYTLAGGYVGAERKILCLLPDFQDDTDTSALIRALHLQADKSLKHPDVLGALLALGVDRNTIGDICISGGEKGRGQTTVYCLPHVAELLASVSQIGRQTVRCELQTIEMDSNEYQRSDDGSLHTGTVSSLRLDTLLSLAFQLPRSKSTEWIDAGQVQLNWKPCRDRGKTLTVGDTISARRLGRAEFLSLEGQSRKKRLIVTLRVFS